MTKYTSEEIKNRLSNIGEAIGTIALEYIVELEKENEQLKAQIEKMKNHNNCKWFHEWNLADIMDEPLDDLSPCQGCKKFSLWETQNE